MEFVITFTGASHAIMAEACLLEKGLGVTVLPLPSQIREGCGICLRADSDTIGPALRCLAERGVEGVRLFSRESVSGRHVYREVRDIGSFMEGSVLLGDAGCPPRTPEPRPEVPPLQRDAISTLISAPPIEEGLMLQGDAGGTVQRDIPHQRSGSKSQPYLSSLLENCTSGGCGAKISPGELSGLLAGLPVIHDENLLVGFGSSDDAAVYRLDETHSIVMTADFFPPMVNDPGTFGRIAAANALSDIYSMGARPLMALNLVCFPQSMEIAILKEVLVGGAEKVAEASAALCGGHSIYDKEPKYGLAVTGIVPTDKILRNDTPGHGHKLILTKPLGTGLIMSALRGGAASGGAIDKAVRSMERLNMYAAEKTVGFDVSACTDITGFGLLAHALEMASDRASIALYPNEIPYFEEAYQYAGDYLMTAAGQRNRNHLAGKADVSRLPFALQELLFDPQTSGGLLICVAPDHAACLLAAIQDGDPAARIIGEVVRRENDVILFGG